MVIDYSLFYMSLTLHAGK